MTIKVHTPTGCYPIERAAMLQEERDDAEFLRDLAERLTRVPVMYGTDQGDSDRLLQIARRIAP